MSLFDFAKKQFVEDDKLSVDMLLPATFSF